MGGGVCVGGVKNQTVEEEERQEKKMEKKKRVWTTNVEASRDPPGGERREPRAKCAHAHVHAHTDTHTHQTCISHGR